MRQDQENSSPPTPYIHPRIPKTNALMPMKHHFNYFILLFANHLIKVTPGSLQN